MSGEAQAILARYRAGHASAEVALMELLIDLEDVVAVARVVAREPALRAVLERHQTGAIQVAAMLRSGMDSPAPAPTVEQGIAQARRLFDWSVQQSEEASVALYSLGSPEVLARATRELVALYLTRGWAAADRRILQIGCGIGRLEEALAPFVRAAHGIDVSTHMIAAATRRCAGLPNVTLATCAGQDLGMYGDACFELVHAIDSFPYLVQAGLELAARHVHEAARVLVPGGDLVIGNFAYGSDDVRDGREVARLAAAAGLRVITSGERPFQLWDGSLFHLRKPRATGRSP